MEEKEYEEMKEEMKAASQTSEWNGSGKTYIYPRFRGLRVQLEA